MGVPVAVVPSPIPGALAHGFTGVSAGQLEAGRALGSLCLQLAPAEAEALRPLRIVPVHGPAMVIPGGSLWPQSWAACAAVVSRVWTRSLTRPVSRTLCLSIGDSALALGLFRVDADTFPFRSKYAGPGSRAHVPVRGLLGRVGRAGLPGVLVPLTFSLAVGSFFFAWPPCGRDCPCLAFFLFSFFLLCFSLVFPPFGPPLLAPSLSLALCASRPPVPFALAFFPFVSFPLVPGAPVLSGFCILLFLASDAPVLALCGSPSLSCPFVSYRPPRPVLCVVPCAAFSCGLLCCMSCCGYLPCVVVGCYALCGVHSGSFLCVVLCCVLVCVAAYCAVFRVAVLRRVVLCPGVRLCAGLFSLALSDAGACCVVPSGSVRRPGLL